MPDQDTHPLTSELFFSPYNYTKNHEYKKKKTIRVFKHLETWSNPPCLSLYYRQLKKTSRKHKWQIKDSVRLFRSPFQAPFMTASSSAVQWRSQHRCQTTCACETSVLAAPKRTDNYWVTVFILDLKSHAISHITRTPLKR